jgi:hypothetical protein
MDNQINLLELERKAFRSTYQDGLWDVRLGLIVISMAIFLVRPEQGYSALNILFFMVGCGVSYAIFWGGKKFITLPRMGQVVFGSIRKKKKTTLALILGGVVTVQIGVVLLSVAGWLNPELGTKINTILNLGSLERLTVAAVGALFVGPGMILVAHFNDFLRGYYIAILTALAVFLMIWLNQPVYPIIIGGLIVLPGLFLLVHFIQKYPLRREETLHG